MLKRKHSAARSSAETIKKKLKYEKYAPKSVAPADAAAFCVSTSTVVKPADAGGTDAGTVPARRVAIAERSGSPLEGRNRTDVSRPYRVPHRRWPAASGMNAFGDVRYSFQYASSLGRTSLRSIGNGGSHSEKPRASVMPGYGGARRRSTPRPRIRSTPDTLNDAWSVTSRPSSAQR